MITDETSVAARELFDFDPHRVACPYPVFSALREDAPVAYFEEVEAFVVTRYDLLTEVLRQPEVFSSRSASGPVTDREMMNLLIELAMEDAEIAELAQGIMGSATTVLLQADPPEHPRQRALVNRAFTPAAIRRIEPYMEQLANQLIDGFIANGRVELLSEFAVPFPMTVIAKALGVGLDHMDEFMRWSKTLVAGIGKRDFGKAELAGIMRTRAAMSAYLLSVVLEREADPQEDLISQLVVAEIDGERLTHNEVVGMVVQFLLAGNDTTAKLLASAMHRLASEPDRADRLRADPELIPSFVEEALRLSPPINGTYRIANVDCELGGVEIPAGSAIWMVFAAGNRDPEQFPGQDAFECPQSSKAHHLTFGFGAHFCLGASLARAESRIALRALLSRCADIELEVEPDAVRYDLSFMLHGIAELPLSFRPVGDEDAR